MKTTTPTGSKFLRAERAARRSGRVFNPAVTKELEKQLFDAILKHHEPPSIGHAYEAARRKVRL